MRRCLRFGRTFSGLWDFWKDKLTKRYYGLLDEILPGSVKSVKEWMVLTGYDGTPGQVLKHSVGYAG